MKDKYAAEVANPDSKVNAIKNQFTKLNDEIKKNELTVKIEKQVEQMMVNLQLEQPMTET